MKGMLFLLFYVIFLCGTATSMFCTYQLIWSDWYNTGELIYWIKWFLSSSVAMVFSRIASNYIVKLNSSPGVNLPPNLPPNVL